jgi:hypothetical protein
LDKEDTTRDVSDINQVRAEAVDEPYDDVFDDDDERDADDTYIVRTGASEGWWMVALGCDE